MQPSHSRVAAIANAIGSLILAGGVSSIITASWVAARPA